MSLLQMSFSGAILILTIVVIRAMSINILPKRTFLILWGVVLLRLLVPFSVPSGLSVYSLVNRNADANVFEGTRVSNVLPIMPTEQWEPTEEVLSQQVPSVSIRFIIWCVGMILCMAFFMISYLHWHFRFQTATMVKNDYAGQWLKVHKLNRPLCIKQSEQVNAPLTYGIFRPVIVMPKDTDWDNAKQIEYMLLHEYVHICRFDTMIKLICALALCVHWFNPVVWVMYLLFNRDIELSCDESVVHKLGLTEKSAYAKMLIGMEARKSGLLPFYNSFSRNSIEQRITAIMKTKKLTIGIFTVSAVIIVAVAVLFATSGKAENKQAKQMIFLSVTSSNIYTSTQEDVTEEVLHEAEVSEYDSPYVGVIQSTVGSDQIPTEDLQSNFGYIGSEVVFNRSGVAVNMDGRWIQFDTETDVSIITGQTDLPDIDVMTLNGDIYFMITNETQLRSIDKYGLYRNYMLQKDIKISDKEWIPIGTLDSPFTGSFNGNGFKIIGFNHKYSDITLFGNAEHASIYNITFLNEDTDKVMDESIVCKDAKECWISDIFYE